MVPRSIPIHWWVIYAELKSVGKFISVITQFLISWGARSHAFHIKSNWDISSPQPPEYINAEGDPPQNQTATNEKEKKRTKMYVSALGVGKFNYREETHQPGPGREEIRDKLANYTHVHSPALTTHVFSWCWWDSQEIGQSGSGPENWVPKGFNLSVFLNSNQILDSTVTLLLS